MKCTEILVYLSIFRYALTEFIETEKEYIENLGSLKDNYVDKLFEAPNLPAEMEGKKDIVFGPLAEIHEFHQG